MHQIQRQIIEVALSCSADALHWQSEVEQLATYALTGVISDTLDALDLPDKSVWIDRIEIDAGVVDARTLEHDLREAVRQGLQREIDRFVVAQKQSLDEDKQSIVNAEQAKEPTAKALRYFLQYGNFPWWYTPTDWFRTEEQFLLTLTLPETVHWLKAQLSDERIHHRLARQFSLTFQQQVLTALFPENRQLWQAMMVATEQTFTGSDRFRALDAVWETSLWLLNRVGYWPPTDLKKTFETIRPYLGGDRLSQPKKTIEWIRAIANQLALPEADFRVDEVEKREYPEHINQQVDQTQKPESDATEPVLEDILYVQNAGLVLLWVFLKQLLTDCYLVDDARLTDPNRAVQLLHYAATGRTNSAESELPLNKLLCGLEFTEPIEPVDLNSDELSLIDDLLRSVVRHWGILKNTSPEGLRVSFLQRNGRLTRESDHYHLLVEQESYDLLLEQLPWGFSVVQLPWMPIPLFVTWT